MHGFRIYHDIQDRFTKSVPCCASSLHDFGRNSAALLERLSLAWPVQHLSKPPPKQAPCQQAYEEHPAIGDPFIHALPPIYDTQQGV